MMTNDDEKMPKNAFKFFCESCDFKCSKHSNYITHLSTDKHKMMTNDDTKTPKNAAAFMCSCGKSYKYRQGLSVHKKKCLQIKESSVITADNKIDATLLMDMIKQNRELQQQLIVSNQTINNNTINNNQKFNINVFLNEQCKDAINFSDFIENIQLSHEDLRNNAQLGFVQGMTKIINDNLNQLTLYQRPLHCTDKKRETMYIRDEDAWNKEKEKAKKKIFEGIQDLSRKGIQELMDWKNINPDYNNMDSNFSQFCLAVQKETLAGENREKYYKKVLNNIQDTTHLTSID
jgi:hypothetical protein